MWYVQKKIEKSARRPGASATWNVKPEVPHGFALPCCINETPQLFEKKFADSGYDTPRDLKASDEAYNNLVACCQYERGGCQQTNEFAALPLVKWKMASARVGAACKAPRDLFAKEGAKGCQWRKIVAPTSKSRYK